MVEAGEETISEAEEEVLQEEDKAEVLQMSVAEEIIRTQVSQVARGLINQMKSHGETIEHQRVVEKILRSLPPRFESLVVTLEEKKDMLETAYQGLDKVKTSKLQILKRDFESLLMKDIELVDSFYTRVVGLINQLKYHGETITNHRVVGKILRSLPPRFESLVVTLEKTKTC